MVDKFERAAKKSLLLDYYIRIRYNDTNYNPLSLQNNTLMFDLIYSIGVQLYKYININARTTFVELV